MYAGRTILSKGGQRVAFHQFPGGQPGQDAVQGIHFGRQRHIGGIEAARESLSARIPLFCHLAVVAVAPYQPSDLLPRQPGHAFEVSQYRALIFPRQHAVPEPLQYPFDEPVMRCLGRPERNIGRTRQECPYLRHCLQLCFIHVDHYAQHHGRSRIVSSSDPFRIGRG